jgi:hypothetical protein
MPVKSGSVSSGIGLFHKKTKPVTALSSGSVCAGMSGKISRQVAQFRPESDFLHQKIKPATLPQVAQFRPESVAQFNSEYPISKDTVTAVLKKNAKNEPLFSDKNRNYPPS